MFDFVLKAGLAPVHWMVDAVVARVGISGIIAGVAGAMLLLSLFPRALKAMYSPRGMVTTATVMFGAMTFLWWEFGSNASADGQAVATASSPGDEPGPDAEDEEEKPEAAGKKKSAEKSASPRRLYSVSQPLPPIPVTGNSVGYVTPLWLSPGIVRLPSLIVAQYRKHAPRIHAAIASHAAAKSAASHAETASVPTGRGGSVANPAAGATKPVQTVAKPGGSQPAAKASTARTGNAGRATIGSGLHVKPNASPGMGSVAQRPTAAQIRHMRNLEAEAYMNRMMGGYMQGQLGGFGGGHPMGGMGHMGGTTHHPAGHPAHPR